MTHQIRIVPCWLVACCCAAFILQSKTTGQTVSTWQAPGVASWNDPANWSAGVPEQAGDHAIFGPGAPAGDVTVLLANPTTAVGTLTYDNTNTLSLFAPALAFDGDAALIDILNGGLVFNTGSFTLSTDLDLSVATGSSAMVGIGFNPAASLTGAGGLNVRGGGLVVFNGANTYGGATHIHNGTVRVFHNASLGAGTGVDANGTFIHTGGTLEIASNSITLPNEKIIIDGGTLTGGAWKLGGPVQLDNGTINGTNWTLNGPLTLNGGDVNGLDWTIAGPLVAAGGSLNGRNWSIQGPVSLDGELTVSGGIGIVQSAINGAGGIRVDTPTGILQLSQSNGYFGQTIIQNGTVQATHNSALGAGTGVDADGTIVHTGGKLFIGAGRQIGNEKLTLQGGTLEGASFTYGGPIVSDGGTISVSNATINGGIDYTGDLIVKGGTGNVFNGVLHGAGNLELRSVGLSLDGVNTYSGQTLIGDGAELITLNPNALGTGSGTDADATVVSKGGSLVIGDGFNGAPLNEKFILDGGTFSSAIVHSEVELRSDSILRNGDFMANVTGAGGPTIAGNDISRVEFFSANTYAGVTRVESGKLDVHHVEGLGTVGAGTFVNGGILTLFVSTNEPITADDAGFVNTRASHYAGPITVGTATVGDGKSSDDGAVVTLDSPLELIGGTASIAPRGQFSLHGGTAGVGRIEFHRGTTNIDTPLNHIGDAVVVTGNVNLNSDFDLKGVWMIGRTAPHFGFPQGTLNINADTTGHLKLLGGEIATADGVAFTSLDPELNVRGGTIDADIRGVSTLRKTSFRTARLEEVGASNDAAISLQRGRLYVADVNGFGSSIGHTTVAASDAELFIAPRGSIDETIYLDNATGISHRGGLIIQGNTDPLSSVTLTESLHLGDIGSIIEVQERGRLVLQAPVVGGGLRFRGATSRDQSDLILTAPNNTLDGVINIGSDNLRGRLSLKDTGRLIAATRVEIPAQGTLRIDNVDANQPDRFNDQIPVWMWGGELEMTPSIGSAANERFGQVVAQYGASTIRAQTGQTIANRTTLTVGELNRHPGTAIDFDGGFAAADAAQPGASVIRIDNAPTLENGIIGGWATVGQTDFATYGTQGIAAITGYENDLNAATSPSNVSHQAASALTTDKQVNSLRLNSAGTLDLGGNTLNIASGGLIQMPFETKVENGTLTAGGDSSGELIIHNHRGGLLDISADITDNGDEPVGVTFSGTIYLRGQNTYTGDTTVIGGGARLFNESALPQGTNITLSAGGLQSEYLAQGVLPVGHVYIRDDGGLNVDSLDANTYTIESGYISRIAGDGPLLKSSVGRGRLHLDERYQGDITVDVGTLEVWAIRGGLQLLEEATVTVRTGGELLVSDDTANIAGVIDLHGGALSFILGSTARPATVSGPVRVLADSEVRVNKGALISGNITGEHDLTFWNLDLNDDFASTELSGNNSGFTGDLHVRGGFILPTSANALGSGETILYEFGALRLSTPVVHGSVVLNGGAIDTYDAQYEFDQAATISGSVTVASHSQIGSKNNITLSGPLALRDGTTLMKTGVGTLIVADVFSVGGDTMLFVNEGIVRLQGLLTASAPVSTLDIVRADRVIFAAGIQLEDGKSLTITDNGVPIDLDISGIDVTIQGNGTLGNSLILGAGAVIAPGTSAGVLTVDGDYTQLLDAVMRMELGGAGPGDYDRLVVTGLFDAGGTFELLLLDGFIPGIGDVFDVLDFNALVTGSVFDQLSLPELGPGRGWDTSALLTSGELRVVPEPGGALGLGLTGLLLRRCRRHTVADRT